MPYFVAFLEDDFFFIFGQFFCIFPVFGRPFFEGHIPVQVFWGVKFFWGVQVFIIGRDVMGYGDIFIEAVCESMVSVDYFQFWVFVGGESFN